MPDCRLIRPGLWVVESSVEGFDVRGVVVAGRERAVVFDTLARPRDMVGVAELLPGLPLNVVYSHGDWDHVWGTAGLGRPPGEILAQERCLSRFLTEIPETLQEKRGGATEDFRDVELIPPTRTFQEAEVLDLGDLALELRTLPGHTPDSIVGYLPQWNVLLAGDSVETPLPYFNENSALDRWIKELELWSETMEIGNLQGDPPLVIPSHGLLGDTGLLENTRSYLLALLEDREPEIPHPLSPFYRETHAQNRILARRWSEASR
jgi:glyoxylase-like metal-dependent hydrolase (beta-lactamase superfamily II)